MNKLEPFNLSVQGVIGIAVMAVLLWLLAMWLFRRQQLGAGLSIFIASFLVLLMVLMTAWTAFNRLPLSGIAVFGAMLGSMAIPTFWVYLAIRSLFPKEKAVMESHG